MEGVRAEYGKKIGALGEAGRDKDRDAVCIEVDVRPVLDLTDSDVLSELSISESRLTGERMVDKALCRAVAGLARTQAYQAIKSPSAALDGGENLNIYTDIPPAMNRSLQLVEEERRPLNYGSEPLVFVPSKDE